MDCLRTQVRPSGMLHARYGVLFSKDLPLLGITIIIIIIAFLTLLTNEHPVTYCAVYNDNGDSQ